MSLQCPGDSHTLGSGEKKPTRVSGARQLNPECHLVLTSLPLFCYPIALQAQAHGPKAAPKDRTPIRMSSWLWPGVGEWLLSAGTRVSYSVP